MSTGKVIIGLLAGAAAGAALAHLCTHEEVADSVKSTTGKVKDALSGKEEYIENIKEKVVNFLFSLIDKLTPDQENKNADAV